MSGRRRRFGFKWMWPVPILLLTASMVHAGSISWTDQPIEDEDGTLLVSGSIEWDIITIDTTDFLRFTLSNTSTDPTPTNGQALSGFLFDVTGGAGVLTVQSATIPDFGGANTLANPPGGTTPNLDAGDLSGQWGCRYGQVRVW